MEINQRIWDVMGRHEAHREVDGPCHHWIHHGTDQVEMMRSWLTDSHSNLSLFFSPFSLRDRASLEDIVTVARGKREREKERGREIVYFYRGAFLSAVTCPGYYILISWSLSDFLVSRTLLLQQLNSINISHYTMHFDVHPVALPW